MTYRIKVGKPDRVGDVPVKLQYRPKWCPFWKTIEYCWVFKSSGNRATSLALAKARLQKVAREHANPQIFPHVEVLLDV